jgi:branched-chain amino acid transport system substrate-binding protein
MGYGRAIIFLVVSLLFSPQAFCDVPAVPKVGFILPLSGEWAFLGNGIRGGALLAQEDLRKKGEQIDLVFEDNQGNLATSVTIAKRLINSTKVDGLISIISGVGKLLNPLASDAKILNIGICSETEVADGKYSFINYLTAEQGVSKFLKQLAPRNALGVFSLNESGFQKILDELKKQAGNSVNISFEDYFEKGTSDFRAMLTKRKFKPVDAWLVLGLSPEIETLVKQARSLGIDTQVVSIEGFGLARDKSVFEGSWFVDSAVPKEEFRERFTQEYGNEVTPGAGHSYDSVMMLASAFEMSRGSSGIIDRGKVAENFRKIKDFPGIIGPLTVKPNGIVWSEASIKVIKNGKPEIITP